MGIGPGGRDHITPAAEKAIRNADVIIGYSAYIPFVSHLTEGKRTIATGMREEDGRAREALNLARQGQKVAVLGTGDSGIYGMAGRILSLLCEENEPEVEVVPGITAAISAAACLGAPLMNDFAVVSLSDLLTPRETIEKRLRHLALADMVVALYNPKSHTRVEPFFMALEILRANRPPHTPVGVVRHALREGQQATLTTLEALDPDTIDMFTVLIVGNSDTTVRSGKMVTSRS